MPTAQRFEDLQVWRVGMEVAEEIYALCRDDPVRRDRSLCDQMQRAAVSIPSNIAEGFENASREQFINYLFIARGSAGELRTQLLLAQRVYRLDANSLLAKCERLSKQIWSFVQYLKTTNYAGDRARPGRPREDPYRKWLARHGAEIKPDGRVGPIERPNPATQRDTSEPET
jgi:four helix bundle protein